ncbi:MAG: hypothetical protein EXR73_00060 [Myxococcales bacterium]|nr:hypothetical protein [Myxococcales bacterium]
MRSATLTELRRWLRLRRAGAARERAQLRGRPPSPEESLAQGFALIDFAVELTGWPIPEDAVSRRQAEAVRQTWRRLRERLPVR